MSLTRFQPISRAAQWSERVQWFDPRTREPQSLVGATLTLGLYQGDGCGPDDYGRRFPGWGNPTLQAATQPDGLGPFVILPDGVSARFTFPASDLARLRPGSALLIVWATVNGRTDEIDRETIPVLAGPTAMPIPVPVVAPPTPDLSAGITVVVDGGEV